LATAPAQGRRDVADGELRYERARRSERLAADFIEGRKAISSWKHLLKEYGDFDWRVTRELLEQESINGFANFSPGSPPSTSKWPKWTLSTKYSARSKNGHLIRSDQVAPEIRFRHPH